MSRKVERVIPLSGLLSWLDFLAQQHSRRAGIMAEQHRADPDAYTAGQAAYHRHYAATCLHLARTIRAKRNWPTDQE